jgi:hypothetical protein
MWTLRELQSTWGTHKRAFIMDLRSHIILNASESNLSQKAWKNLILFFKNSARKLSLVLLRALFSSEKEDFSVLYCWRDFKSANREFFVCYIWLSHYKWISFKTHINASLHHRLHAFWERTSEASKWFHMVNVHCELIVRKFNQ